MILKRSTALFLALLIMVLPLLYGAKLREPNWNLYVYGQTFSVWPSAAEFSTGIYSTAISGEIDYKQDKERFMEQALQLKTDGYIETFWEANQTIPVAYTTRAKLQSRLLTENITHIAAYDSYKIGEPLGMDIANGQWLLNHGIYSRLNKEIRVNAASQIYVSPLEQAPWGIKNSTTAASRDEFLVGLAKAAYGPIESRPVYIETDAWRYAKAVVWREEVRQTRSRYSTDSNWGSWNPSPPTVTGYTYLEATMEQTYGCPSLVYNNDTLQEVNGYVMQRVSGHPDWDSDYVWNMPTGSDTSQTRTGYRYRFRGEFITHPDGHDGSILSRYNNDYWSYVTTDVWELYFHKLLSMGVLDYDVAFFGESGNSNYYAGPDGDTFELQGANKDPSLISGAAKYLLEEYDNYGSIEADQEDSIIKFPAYAPELGIAFWDKTYTLRDLNAEIIGDTKVLGRNYNLSDGVITTDVPSLNAWRDDLGLPREMYMKNQTLTNIAALRMIERVMRVQEKNMSALEANIITQKYGAKYLNNIPDRDRKTVEYLIAQGIVDFENFDEYANLYSVLSREFCYTLIYRLANEAARTDFSKLLLTDASSIAAGLPTGYNNYQNSLLTNSSGALDKFVSDSGQLVYEPQNPNSPELSLFSSVFVEQVVVSSSGNPVYHVIVNMDDPVKYLYRGLPLVMTQYSYGADQPVGMNSKKSPAVPLPGKQLWPQESSAKHQYYQVYLDNMIGSRGQSVINDIVAFTHYVTEKGVHPSAASTALPDNPVGLSVNTSIGYEAIRERMRLGFSQNMDKTGIVNVWKPQGSDRYYMDISIAAVDADSASTFVMANIVPLTHGLLQESEVSSAVSKGKNTLMVDVNNSGIMSGAKYDKDIVIGAASSIVMNHGSGIAGTTILSGDMRGEVNGVGMMSADIAQHIMPNMGFETTGRRQMIAANSPVLNTHNTSVFSSSTNQRSSAQIRFFANPDTDKANTTRTIYSGQNNYRTTQLNLYNIENAKRYLNASTANTGDLFTTTRTYKYTVVTSDKTGRVASGIRAGSTTKQPVYRDLDYGYFFIVPNSNGGQTVVPLTPEEITSMDDWVIRTESVDVTIVLQLVPDIPRPSEQHYLVGKDIQPGATMMDLYNWIYTRPENVELARLWDYNLGVTNAIMKTMGLTSESIKSGYLYPRVSLLVDKAPLQSGEQALSEAQLNEISCQFMVEVGSKLPSAWVAAFIGSQSLYNQILSDMSDSDLAAAVASGSIGKDPDPAYFRFLKGVENGILPSRVYGSLPLWASLYFYHAPLQNSVNTTYLHSRLHMPYFEAFPILSFSGANKIYGVHEWQDGDSSVATQSDSYAPYVISDFGQLYVDLDYIQYTYNDSANALVWSGVSMSGRSAVGTKVTIAGDDSQQSEWIVVADDELELHLVSTSMIQAIVLGKRFVDFKNNEIGITKAGEAYVHKFFGIPRDAEINERTTYNFEPFNTAVLDSSDNPLGSKFIEVVDGGLKVFSWDLSRAAGNQKFEVGVSDKESVWFRPFVRLSKSAWNISSDGKRVEWSKRFMGAEYKYYSPKHNISLITADILPTDSGNRTTLGKIAQANFTIGQVQGYKDSTGNITVTIPYSSSLVTSDLQPRNDLIADQLSALSTPIVTPDNKAYSAMDYMSSQTVAEYSQHYPYYSDTLVTINGKLHVVTANGPKPYTPASTVNTVAVSLDIDDDVSVVVVEDTSGQYISVTMDSHQDRAPAIKTNKQEYNLIANFASDEWVAPVAGHYYQGVSDAGIYFDALLNYTNMMRTTSLISKMIWLILVVFMTMSVLLVLARAIRVNTLMYSWFHSLWDTTGIDVLKLMSLTIVKTEESPPGWGKTLLLSLTLILVPTLIVALMQGFGVNFY